jgi:diguanylate cyclase (GGDEF)-like protein
MNLPARESSGAALLDDGGAVRKPLVLIVDDQPMSIQRLLEILEAEYQICIATSGSQALDFCETRLPDLILLDVVMPDMDGYEVSRRLKSRDLTAQIPIVFMTVRNDPADEAQALDGGAADFISKPFHEKAVRARVRTQLTLKLLTDRFHSLAMIDGLTGLANRAQFDSMLGQQWGHCLRMEVPLAIILVDIDFFKRYNNSYGHHAGDACIQAVAATLKTNLRRPQDLVARYGVKEFACILPETPLAGARRKALELERAIRGLAIPHKASDVAAVVTASLGVAAGIPRQGTAPDEVILAADLLLCAAKQGGRGRVESAARDLAAGPIFTGAACT